jgi:putative transposase
VWTTKYRKRVLRSAIAHRVRELIRETCLAHDVEILKGHVSVDHIHLFVSSPPKLSVSKLVMYLKGKTSRKMLMEFSEMKRQFWGSHIWGRGHFVASSGNVTDAVIEEYIKLQGDPDNVSQDDFNIEEP